MEKTFVTYFPVEEGKSGIKIKPENKGKFTATKKRTGKTTEELTHSKNPLTRKRAIFAQNAKKWKHEEGGQIEYFQSGGIYRPKQPLKEVTVTTPKSTDNYLHYYLLYRLSGENPGSVNYTPEEDSGSIDKFFLFPDKLDQKLKNLKDQYDEIQRKKYEEFLEDPLTPIKNIYRKLQGKSTSNDINPIKSPEYYLERSKQNRKRMKKLVPKAQQGYKVQKGDTFGGIAQKHKMTVQQLQQLNPNITNPDKIREGITLNISQPIKQVKTIDGIKVPDNLNRDIPAKYLEYGNAYRTFDRAYNQWASRNPQVKLNGVSVNTSDLKDYIYDLAMHESSFDNNKVNGSHRGYFQIINYRGNDPFNALIKHMNERLSRLTIDDISRARQRKISDAAILAKIHNQGDNFVNWLWGGQDTKDGVGTRVSQYGNDWAPKLNILHKVITQKALKPGEYSILGKNQSYETIAPTVRYPGVIMNNTASLLKREYQKHYPNRNPENPWLNDTIFIPRIR